MDKEKRAAYMREYRKKTSTYYLKHAAHVKAWRHRNRDKLRAHSAVENAINRGKLTKPHYCSSCLNEVKLHAHHPDYNKPLDIVWLCEPCHKTTHRERILS